MRHYKKIFFITILLISVFYYNSRSSGNIQNTLQDFIPEATKFQLISGSYYNAYSGDKLLGYVGSESAVGYAGPVKVMIFIGTDGKVKDLKVTDNIETPSFFSRVMAGDYLDKFIGKEATDPFQAGDDIDAITGATYTSKGIANAVEKAAHQIAVNQLALQVPGGNKISFPLEHFILLGLIILVIVLHKLNLTKLRYLTLLFSLIFIGFMQKSPVSLGNMAILLSGNIPGLQELPFWVLMVIGLLLIIIITGKNLYCYWMCPFGAIAEATGKLGKSGKVSYNVCPRKKKQLRNLRLLLAWGALVFGFLIGNPSISSYEVFAPVFALEGTAAQWLLLPLMLFSGIFIARFWCTFFCPVGGIIELLVKIRREIVNWIKKRPATNKQEISS